MTDIRYPHWKIRGRPTPNEKLVICQKCGAANWVPHGSGIIFCHGRMREATPEQYEIGRASLKEVVDG